MMTVDELTRQAFAALLRGDVAERDRLIRMAMDLHKRGETLRAGGPLVSGELIVLKEKDHEKVESEKAGEEAESGICQEGSAERTEREEGGEEG